MYPIRNRSLLWLVRSNGIGISMVLDYKSGEILCHKWGNYVVCDECYFF